MVSIANIVFNPFTNDSRVLKESVSLSSNGYLVEVIAHGGENLPSKEEIDGFSVKRFAYLDRKKTVSLFGKLFIYLKWSALVVQYTKNFNILHCNDLNTLPIAFIVKKFYNKDIKIVYDAHEYETEVIGLSGIRQKITKLLEKSLISYADKVITVSESIAQAYVKLYKIEKPALVLNTPPFQEIEKKNLFREKFHIREERTIFLYQGGLSRGRGIEILLEAFKGIENSDRSCIIFMGYGPLEEEIKQASAVYENIHFHPAVTPDVLLDYTASADFGISSIEDSCLSYRYCLPNKMFEYLMAGIPVIVSNLPEMKKIIDTHQVGVIAKENTPTGLQSAVGKALNLDRSVLQNNIRKVKSIYNWQTQEQTLLSVYKELTQ